MRILKLLLTSIAIFLIIVALIENESIIDFLKKNAAVGFQKEWKPDHQYIEAFEAIVPPIIETYRPDVIVMQNGVDTHFQDELGQLILTTHSFSHIAERVHQLAHKFAHGRLVAVGGGGYSYLSVPRCWTIILAKLAGFELPNEIPQIWQDHFREITGLEPPTHVFDKTTPQLSELAEARVGRFVNQSIQRVKDMVFPLLSIKE